jgi:hypothetical protein
MDVFVNLLPPSYLVNLENSPKDRKQKEKQNHQSSKVDEVDDKDPSQSPIKSTSNWNELDRRSGTDRRDQNKCRGRWLESREEKNRRELKKAIQIKV